MLYAVTYDRELFAHAHSELREGLYSTKSDKPYFFCHCYMSEDQYYTGTATDRSDREGLSYNLVR